MQLVEITLAVLLSLTAAFESGLEHLKDKKYEPAVAKFTEVIEAKSRVTDLFEWSLHYRAEAYLGLEKKEEAIKDLTQLILNTSDAGRRAQAVKLFKIAGGDFKTLQPKDLPRVMVQKLLLAAAQGDRKEVDKYVTGPLLAMLRMTEIVQKQEGRGRGILEELGREMKDIKVLSESVDETGEKATLSAMMDGRVLTFDLWQKAGNWAIAEMTGFAKPGGRPQFANEGHDHNHGKLGPIDNENMLRQLGIGLLVYAADHANSFPAKLSDIAPVMKGLPFPVKWRHPKTGEELLYLYRSGLKSDAPRQTPIAAAPRPVDGKWKVLFVDGRVEMLAEAEFKKVITESKWAIPELMSKDDVPAEVEAEVTELIHQLGSSDFKVRRAARKRLKAIGANAFPLLQEHKNSEDPELRAAVRELLGH